MWNSPPGNLSQVTLFSHGEIMRLLNSSRVFKTLQLKTLSKTWKHTCPMLLSDLTGSWVTQQKWKILYNVDENTIEQCFALKVVQYCLALSTILSSNVTTILAQLYWTILLRTSWRGSKTLFNPVILQAQILLVTSG